MGAISSVSSVYETSPWGFESPHPFLNMAVKVRTRLNPFQILYISQAIERELGRMEKSSGVYQDRIIDIDLIMYDQLELDTPQLKLPHPLYKERDFVMRPLSEIL